MELRGLRDRKVMQNICFLFKSKTMYILDTKTLKIMKRFVVRLAFLRTGDGWSNNWKSETDPHSYRETVLVGKYRFLLSWM